MASLTRWTWVWGNSGSWWNREAWHAAIHGVAKSRTQLSDWTELNWTELKINISAIIDYVSCILPHQRKLQMALLVNSTHPPQNYFLFVASAVVLSYFSCLILVFPYYNISCCKDFIFLFAFLVMFLMGCTSVVAQMVKNPPVMQDTQVWSVVQVDPLEKGMGIHFSILAWRIPLTEEPGGL